MLAPSVPCRETSKSFAHLACQPRWCTGSPSLVDNLLHQQGQDTLTKVVVEASVSPRYFLSAEPTCQTLDNFRKSAFEQYLEAGLVYGYLCVVLRN
jgi:hypothetical protein